MHRTHCYYEQILKEEVKQESSVTQRRHVCAFTPSSHVQINTHRMLLLFFSPCRAYLTYTSVFLWLVAKVWPGAIYQNNLLSGGNLLLTDKSLPSVGCNGSHLSFFSEYCPSRPPPRQTPLNDCSLFHSFRSKSTAAAFTPPYGPHEPNSAEPVEVRDFIPPQPRNVITAELFCTDKNSSVRAITLLCHYFIIIIPWKWVSIKSHTPVASGSSVHPNVTCVNSLG